MAQLPAAINTRLRRLQVALNMTLRGATQSTHAEMPLGENHCDDDGWVYVDICMQLGWAACVEEVGKLSTSGIQRLTESSISLFGRGAGEILVGLAELIHADKAGARLRVRLFRMYRGESPTKKHLIGEYTAGADIVSDPARVIMASPPGEDRESTPDITTRERAVEAKLRQVFDGACDVICSEGYAATTMRKVAKASGLPLSSIYQYIDTKEDLLFMITSICMEEIFQYMHSELMVEGSATEKMKHAVGTYLRYVSKNRRYINLVYRETRSLSAANREKIFDIERRFTQLWEFIIIDGNKAKEFHVDKPNLAANLVYFACNLWSLRYWNVQEYTEDEVRDYLLRFILKGLKTQ